MGNKIAIDVVLIPPPSIQELAIKLNKSFPHPQEENYLLHPEICMSHLIEYYVI